MSLEAVMICLDNSEWMRNGDYSPTRLAAQTETINYLTEAKLRNHQDSTVGLLSMAGKRIEVHVAPCRSPGKIVKALTKEVKIGGKSDVLGALKTAQLALKNRQNKNLRQRIILFVGSPIEDDEKQFVKLGKIFKKHNVAVDVINFGEENGSNGNVEKLEAFINAVKNGDNSHFLTVPPGPHELSDLVLTSGVMHGQGGAGLGGLGNLGDLGVIPANLGGAAPGAARGPGTGGATAPGGPGNAPLIGVDGIPVDPNVDPETYMALKASLEEEYHRQQKLAKEREEKAKKDAASSSASTTASTSTTKPATTTSSSSSSTSTSSSSGEAPMETEEEGGEEEEEDEAEALLLAQALSMSIGAGEGETTSTPISSTTSSSSSSSSGSASSSTPAPTTAASSSESKHPDKMEDEEQPDLTLALTDPNFLSSLLESVPGVNKDQISMDSILEGLTGGTGSTGGSTSSDTAGTPVTPEDSQAKKKKKPTKPGKKGGKKRKNSK